MARKTPEDPPYWFFFLAMAVVLSITCGIFGLLAWATVKLVNHFT